MNWVQYATVHAEHVLVGFLLLGIVVVELLNLILNVSFLQVLHHAIGIVVCVRPFYLPASIILDLFLRWKLLLRL